MGAKRQLHHRTAQGIKKAIVPHKHNGYRPHLVRSKGLVLLVIAAMGLQLGSLAQPGSVLGETQDVTQHQLLRATNAARERNSKPPLSLNEKLSYAATLKAQDMFKEQYWAHNSPNGTTPWVWIEKAGYDYGYAGENLARGFRTSQGVVTAWMNSPEHRDNMLSERYTNVGFAALTGTLEGEKTTLVVAEYGMPATSLLQSSTFLSAQSGTLGPLSRFGIALQSMNPAALASIGLLLLGAVVALAAHSARKQLPKQWRTSWRRHHGFYKAVGMMLLIAIVIAVYGGGQI